MNTEQLYYTTQEVADLLRIDVGTVRRYIKTGKMKAVKLENRFLRIPRSEIEYLLPKGEN